jgi:ACS family D-galactonate transporter-like MFS transporter
VVTAGAASRQRFVIVGMLFVSVVISYVDRSNLSIVGPELAGVLHLTPVKMGIIFSGFGWSYALLQIPASRFVDRVHPRFLYSFVLALWSLATAALALVSGFAGLLLLRLLIGAFEAPSSPINNRVAATWFGENERAGAIGCYTSGQFVGLAFLVPLLSWVDSSFGWRAIFALTGLVGVLWAAIWLILYRDPRYFFGVNQAEVDLIAASGGIPDLSQHSAQDKGIFWRDLRAVVSSRKLWALYIGQFGLVSTQWFFLTWFPSYLVMYRHLSFVKSGALASIPFLGAFIGVLFGGLLSDWLLRRGASLTVARKVPIIFGLLLSSSIVGANYVESPVLVMTFFTCSFFGSACASITWSLVATIAPERLIGLTGGVFNFVGNLAAIGVPVVVGLLIRGPDFTRPLMFVSATALLGALCYIGPIGKIERIESLT